MDAQKEREQLVEELAWARRRIEDLEASTAELTLADLMFRHVADKIGEVFWLFDHTKQKVLYVSPAYDRIWGRAAKTLYRDFGEWLDSIHPEDRPGATASFAAIVHNDGGQKREYRIVRPDGSIRQICDRGFAIRSAAGDVIWIVGVSEDVTEQRLAEEALKQSREEYRRLAGIVVSAQEAERSRIARELHDDTTQRLSRLAMDAAALQRADPNVSPEMQSKIGHLQHSLEDAALQVQALSRVLHPSVLRDLGLRDAMLSECTALRVREGIEVAASLDEAPADLPEDMALSLLRVLQEALWNVTKHSCAHRVEISFQAQADELLLTIRDDGIGFDCQRMMSRAGLGLVSMQERAHLMLGDLKIRSQPGRGTTIQARIPLVEAAR